MSTKVLFIVFTIYGVFIAITDSKPLFGIAKQQQLEPISSKHIKFFKDFMFPSETTDTTGTRFKQVDTEKSGDFVFPTDYKESTVPKFIFFKNTKSRNFTVSTKAAVTTESTTVESVPDESLDIIDENEEVPEKNVEIVDFAFPSDVTSSRLTNYNDDESHKVDNRIGLACALALCIGKK